MNHKFYYEKVIDEILSMLKNNLIVLYNYNDESLLNLKKYCENKVHKKYKNLEYNNLVFFAEEALAELINCEYFYDFRDID